jgi:25S rRNA (uracil2843-N3)-methyltransferase
MSKYVRQEKSRRKHPIISSSTSIIKAPVDPTAIKERPEWKGPGFVKKTPKQPPHPVPSPSASATLNAQQNLLPIELQQLLLNIFRTTFPICQDYEALKPMLQQIKDALSERNFEKAFRCLDWMEAYAVRWSPSRALCYVAVLAELCEEFREEEWIKCLFGSEKHDIEGSTISNGKFVRQSKVVCFGGGAAEVMAFGAILRHVLSISADVMTMRSPSLSESGCSSGSESSPFPLLLELHLLDSTKWAPIISSLLFGLTTPPTLSRYASASARARNAPFLFPDILKASSQQCNILEASQNELVSMIGAKPALITLFHTLNDLLASSVAKCAAFLLKLTMAAPKNSFLLIIDGLDSSSEIIVGKDDQGREKNTYPMRYLLDMVLMEKQLSAAVDQKQSWERLVGDQSRYFRIPEGLTYPVRLENIRFQVYLFKKL